MVDQAIWSKKMSSGARRTPVSAEQVCFVCTLSSEDLWVDILVNLLVSVCLCWQARVYNRQVRPAVLDPNSRQKWTNTVHQPEYLVGDEVRSRTLLHHVYTWNAVATCLHVERLERYQNCSRLYLWHTRISLVVVFFFFPFSIPHWLSTVHR